MNTKMIGIVVLVLVVLGGGYFMMNKNTQTAPADEAAMEQPKEEAMVEQGTENVDDTAVTEEVTGEDAAMEEGVKEFTVDGTDFSFSVKEMKVKKGDTVKVTFNNTKGFHDWVIDEFNAKTKQLKEGESETIEFVADQAGTYEYYCSVGKHRQNGMVGKLIVE